MFPFQMEWQTRTERMDRKWEECDLVCIVMCKGMFCSTFSQQFCMIFTLQPICLLPLIGILDILYHFFFHYLVKVLTSFYNILEIIRMLNETRTLHYKPMFSINDAVLSDNHIQFPWGATCTLCHNLKHCLHQPIFLSFYFIYFSATPVS